MKKLFVLIITTLLINNNIAFSQTNAIQVPYKTAQVIKLEKDIDSNEKNPFVSAGLSALLPGVGQLYNEEYLKGITIFSSMTLLLLAEFLYIQPQNKIAEKDKKQDSLLDLATTAIRISIPSLWVYSWGSAYHTVTPEYKKKLKEDSQKFDIETYNNNIQVSLLRIDF